MSTTEIKTSVMLRAEPPRATVASHAATESKLNLPGLAMTGARIADCEKTWRALNPQDNDASFKTE